jgi:hypothetical protein
VRGRQVSQYRESLLFGCFTAKLAVYMVDLVIGKSMLMITKKRIGVCQGFIRICLPGMAMPMGMAVMMILVMVLRGCCRLVMAGVGRIGLVVVRHQVMHQ